MALLWYAWLLSSRFNASKWLTVRYQTSCSFSFPIDNASWKFLQKATKIIVINEAEGKTSKILLDMDTKSEANNLLALLQQYSTKARQEASLRKEEANAAPLTSKMADVSTSVDETVANYDDPSTSFLETSTTSYTDFILSSNDNDHAILNGASSTLPNPFHDMEADNFEAANFVSSGTEAQPFHPLRTTAASTDFDTPANSGLDPRFTDLEPLVDFQRPKSSGTHPSLLPFYETLQDVYGRWDTLTDAEKAAWMPED